MDIQGLKTGVIKTDALLHQMTNSFFFALIWVKNSQEPNGRWTDFGYTGMVAAQLNVVGSDLLSDNLDRAVHYIKSRQIKSGLFAPDGGGGEPALVDTNLAIWGLNSCGEFLNAGQLKENLDFIEQWILNIKLNAAYHAYTTLAALGGLRKTGRHSQAQVERIKNLVAEWINSDVNWASGDWIGEQPLRPRDVTRNTAVALLGLEKAGVQPDSARVDCAIARLGKGLTDPETRTHNRTMAWILKSFVAWGYDLESDLVRDAVVHLIDNQNKDGSWGDTKETNGNDIHTSRVLESFSLLFRRQYVNQSFFEAVQPYLMTKYLENRIEQEVEIKAKVIGARIESESRTIESENRSLRLRVSSLLVILGGVSIALTILGIILALPNFP